MFVVRWTIVVMSMKDIGNVLYLLSLKYPHFYYIGLLLIPMGPLYNYYVAKNLLKILRVFFPSPTYMLRGRRKKKICHIMEPKVYLRIWCIEIEVESSDI